MNKFHVGCGKNIGYRHFITQLPPEIKVLLECICLNQNDKSISRTNLQLKNEFMDWEKILKLSVQHRVFPLVYKTFRNNNIPGISASILKQFRNYYNQNNLKMINLTGELIRLTELLKENNIHIFSLKGPPLAEMLYHDISLRSSLDLDILINSNDTNSVEQILFREGYKGIRNAKISYLKDRRRYVRQYHHSGYYNSNKGIYIEVHWRFLEIKGRFDNIPFEEIWERKEYITLDKTAIPILPKDILFFFLTVHGAKHSWSRLSWLYDCNKFINSNLISNWDLMAEKAKKYKLESIVGQVLLLCTILFDNSKAEKLMKLFENKKSVKLALLALPIVFSDVPMNLLHPFLKKYYLQKWYSFTLQESLLNKIIYIFRHFEPSMDDEKMLSLPKLLYPLYFFARPFLILLRVKRKMDSIKYRNEHF